MSLITSSGQGWLTLFSDVKSVSWNFYCLLIHALHLMQLQWAVCMHNVPSSHVNHGRDCIPVNLMIRILQQSVLKKIRSMKLQKVSSLRIELRTSGFLTACIRKWICVL